MVTAPRSRAYPYLAAILCLFACPVAASAQVFDFEDETATFVTPPMVARPGALSTLTMTKFGMTVTITRPGSAFDITENSGPQAGKPGAFGLNSLDPFYAETTNDFFRADFSLPIFGVSLDYGDYGNDTDSTFLRAFDGIGGTGSMIDSAAGGNASFTGFGTIGVSGGGIQSIEFGGGSAGFPNSVFWDNISVDAEPPAVPEPSSMVALAIGLPVGGVMLRKRRRKS